MLKIYLHGKSNTWREFNSKNIKQENCDFLLDFACGDRKSRNRLDNIQYNIYIYKMHTSYLECEFFENLIMLY